MGKGADFYAGLPPSPLHRASVGVLFVVGAYLARYGVCDSKGAPNQPSNIVRISQPDPDMGHRCLHCRAATREDGSTRVVDRRLIAEELLRLQGFGDDLLSRSSPGGFTQGQLTDLAGNMFCGSVCAATIIASLACIPFAEAFALSKARRALVEPLPSGDEPAAPQEAPVASAEEVADHSDSDSPLAFA